MAAFFLRAASAFASLRRAAFASFSAAASAAALVFSASAAASFALYPRPVRDCSFCCQKQQALN